MLEKITTITDGSFEFKELLDCNSKYTIIARHIDFEVKSNEISTDTKISKENYINIQLIEIKVVEEFITDKGVMLIKTDPIYFDLNKSDIREDAAIELNKVVKIMKNNPTIKIELNSHTDSRAPDGYNMRLSNDRSKSSINYIISQGINPARLSGKGYGETRLVNKCSNGVKCTNSEHEENRRTEFIVINK
ncbi:MAG: outer membrane protein OmpA-like peptidoglycan-associated protein [Porticoccaceae bacterium]